MKVVLQKDVPKIGKRGDIVSVKDGFGRNYLIPQGLASFADKKALAQARTRKENVVKKIEERSREREHYKERLQTVRLTLTRKANEKGVLFDSFDVRELLELLARQGFTLIKEHQVEGLPIKSLGEYGIKVHIGDEIILIPITIHAAS